jgi:IS30 family transposase
MKKYRRLTPGNRYQIEALLNSGQSLRFIARQLGCSASTISRELDKGCWRGETDYLAADAQRVTQSLLHAIHQSTRKIRAETESYIRSKLKLDWSPEQICGRMSLLKMKTKVSYPTIYRYLERNRTLRKHLRILRKKRKDRKAPQWRPHWFMLDRVPIEKRPKIVEARKRLGDYERDTVLGKRGGPALLTMVDRTSRLLKLAWVPKSTAEHIHRATVSHLKREPHHTITNDNGFEFMYHAKTSKALRVPIYFNRAFHAWERGTNENTNGLLRQYFPKKHDIGQLTWKQINTIEKRLNRRPRKILGYQTPLEVHTKMKSSVLR